ncbi:MAG: acyl-CoA dehydrogenase [Paracoccaceae bacterium]|jgi:acyl-CoA dehydrogenase
MSDTARLLDDALDRLLRRQLPDAMARNASDLPDTLMAKMIEAGFTLVLAGEENGGLGGSLTDAACVAWRCGWHATPLPIVEMLLLPVLDLPGDPSRISLAHGNLATAPILKTTQSIRIGNGSENRTVAADKAHSFRSIPDAQWCRLENTDANHDDAIMTMGALLTTAAMTGAMARIMEIAIDHVETRSQFGRPLKKFQAIQHQLAEATSELTITEAALASALDAHDAGKGRLLLSNSAKAQAGVAATKIAATAHQVLGAIGFTEEHELHHFTKKLWQWRDSWGRQIDCDLAIGRAACAAPDGLWAYITNEKESA